jgi:hypothetical protein
LAALFVRGDQHVQNDQDVLLPRHVSFPVRRCVGVLRYACIYCDAQCFAEQQKMTARYGTTYGASDQGVLLESATFDEFSAAGYAIQDS